MRAAILAAVFWPDFLTLAGKCRIVSGDKNALRRPAAAGAVEYLLQWEDTGMNIIKKTEGSALTIALEGRLDTSTAPQLEAEIRALDGVTELTIDLAALEYLSSAGLRVLLAAQKIMNKQGSMRVCHVNETIMEVFEVTGFIDILTIE